MSRTRKQQELEEKLILEEYDPETQEEKAEDESLLIGDEKNDVTERERAASIVKEAYKKITCGHAIIRTQFSYFVLFGVVFFGLAIPIFFIVMCITGKWFTIAEIFVVFICCAASWGGAYMLYWVFLRTTKKFFDIYYFQQNKKRIIIYQNYKYTIYYRNRKELVCIENKTHKWIERYVRDDFMNLKLGFNALVGELKYQKLKKGGYGIWTPARYSTATQLHSFSGYASLRVDEEYNPIRLFIDGEAILFKINTERGDINNYDNLVVINSLMDSHKAILNNNPYLNILNTAIGIIL